MKYISASILLIALLLQNFSRYIIVLDYTLNSNYISKNLCENRNKPKCCCHGKCYLKKQLAKTDNEQNPSSSNTQKDKNEDLFFAEERTSAPDCFISMVKKVYFIHNDLLIPHNLFGSIFRPPQV